MPVLSESVLAAIKQRRTARADQLIAPAPNADQLRLILEAGAQAPDHGHLVPFRFIEVQPDSREKLADLCEKATQSLQGELLPPARIKARAKALEGPCLIVLVARIQDHPKITKQDQWLSVGAVLENILLAAQALGFAVAIRTGDVFAEPAFQQGLALKEDEFCVGFLVFGQAQEWPPVKKKPALATLLTQW